MSEMKVPLKDMKFVLYDVFNALSQWKNDPILKERVDRETADAILEEGAKITSQLIAPLNQTGDEQGAVHLPDGSVKTPEGFVDAYRTFAEGGWVGLTGEPEYGGMGMPKMLGVLFEEMLYSANNSFTLYPGLTAGACLSLNAHGSEALKSLYLPPLYDGRWAATMCLTEAHAGTDLGLMRTKAEPSDDGKYLITGNKIFITGGEQDLTENIIHLVLAKLPDAPSGTKGISLFLVPKFLVNDAGEIGEKNQVSCGSIEHKMGIKASATCVMNFDSAVGYLVGDAHKGLAAMFTMMNYERLSIGIQGIGCSQRSYQVALEYAKDRLQSRCPGGAQRPDLPADPILVHGDVRRMLLTQKAITEGSRAFAVYAAQQLDLAKYSTDEKVVEKASILVALLTPVAKAFFTDLGLESTIHGQQVLGGHGYIKEWGQEQLVRDARIAQIYEGTNGIQSLDLVGRKLVANNGSFVQIFLDDVKSYMASIPNDSPVGSSLAKVEAAVILLENTSEWVLSQAKTDPCVVSCVAVNYLHLFGYTAYGYMFLRMAEAAAKRIQSDDALFYEAKLETARFYFDHLLSRAHSLHQQILSGTDCLMNMSEEAFSAAWD